MVIWFQGEDDKHQKGIWENFPIKALLEDDGIAWSIRMGWTMPSSNRHVLKFGKILLLQSRNRKSKQHWVHNRYES